MRAHMLSCYLRSMETLQSAPDPKDLTLSIDERRELIVWAADCMYRILPIFEEQYPADPRLRQGLAAVAEFNRGALSVGTMRQHALLCHATARDCETPSAQAVARACGHAIAIAQYCVHGHPYGLWQSHVRRLLLRLGTVRPRLHKP